MTILFYSPIADETEQRLQRALEAASLNESLEIHRDIESLNRRLRKPRYNLDIAVVNVDIDQVLGVQEIVALEKAA